MPLANLDAGHWSRVMLWSAFAAICYPMLWLAYFAADFADFEAGYLALVTDGIISFLMVFIGTALAIHYGARQSERLSVPRAIGYAFVLAWFAVTISVAWSLYSVRSSTDLLATLVASPFLVVIAAPGFLVVAAAVWTERLLLQSTPRSPHAMPEI